MEYGSVKTVGVTSQVYKEGSAREPGRERGKRKQRGGVEGGGRGGEAKGEQEGRGVKEVREGQGESGCEETRNWPRKGMGH